jgi:hypothetical protein
MPLSRNFQSRIAADVASAKPLTATEADRYYIHIDGAGIDGGQEPVDKTNP